MTWPNVRAPRNLGNTALLALVACRETYEIEGQSRRIFQHGCSKKCDRKIIISTSRLDSETMRQLPHIDAANRARAQRRARARLARRYTVAATRVSRQPQESRRPPVAGVLKVLMATHSQTSRAIRKGGGRGRAFTGSFLTLSSPVGIPGGGAHVHPGWKTGHCSSGRSTHAPGVALAPCSPPRSALPQSGAI